MMESVSDFEIAQHRIRAYQRKRFVLRLWIVIFVLLIALNVVFGGVVAGNLIPFEVGSFIMILVTAIQLYYSAPSRLLSESLINKEMVWLFGDDWQDFTGAEEYLFAQDRIRRRRLGRWLFAFHAPIFLFLNWLIIGIAQSVSQYGSRSEAQTVNIGLFIIVGLWTLLLIGQGVQAFPTAGMLAKRERRAAEDLSSEIWKMRPGKPKHAEKVKRRPLYGIGDDGELIEIGETEDDKPKRDTSI